MAAITTTIISSVSVNPAWRFMEFLHFITVAIFGRCPLRRRVSR
jgi:hypothetical protein